MKTLRRKRTLPSSPPLISSVQFVTLLKQNVLRGCRLAWTGGFLSPARNCPRLISGDRKWDGSEFQTTGAATVKLRRYTSRSNGGLRISGWIGHLSCLTIFTTSLSVTAFLRRAGGSMLESTGSHGRGVERRVPEMRRMVEFNCTSTWLVWAERDQTGAQYSAAE